MNQHLKAKIEIKQTFLRSLEIERDRYRALRQRYRPSDHNHSYYQSRVAKCETLIREAQKEIKVLEKELVEVKGTPLKQTFKSARMTGIEYRDNSR